MRWTRSKLLLFSLFWGVVCSSGCTARDRTVDDSVDLVKDMLVVLEKHVSNPENAVPGIREFMLENRLRMLGLSRLEEAEIKGLSREDRVRMNVRFLKSLAPYKARLNRVAEVYRQHPEVMNSMRKVLRELGVKPDQD